MAVGSLGLVALVHPGVGASPSSAAMNARAVPAANHFTGPSARAPAAPTTHSTSTSTFNAGMNAASRALAASKAAGISPNYVFVPRPSASPTQVAASQSAGYVSPLYSSTPAPVGLGEFGLMNNSMGGVTPFILNTTSVQATFDPSANGGPNATDLADSSPDGYGVQLNSVATNITLFGQPGYSFWTQNVIEYYPYEQVIYLITNVWNFSSPASYLSSNVFYQHGPLGTQVGNEYYYAFAGPIPLAYPYNMTFTMTSNITDGRNAVYFSLTATNATDALVLNYTDYDYVIFNSLGASTPALTVPSNYTANGFSYNPLGLTDDFEITIGGPGGGSQTTFLSANATETLSYWNATTGSYQAVPSAYSYGGETGETSVGASMSWTTGINGAPVGIMSTGPSLLGGLWNASSPAGGPATVYLNINPGNAFVIVEYTGVSSSAFNISEPELAPTVTTSELTLPAGTYEFGFGISYYDPVILPDVPLAPGSVTYLNESLAWDSSQGVYTPLWAWTNTQVGNISTSGAGTMASPYIIVNNQYTELGPLFGVLNDYGFPVFPGVYFIGTTAYAEFASPPSFQVDTSGAHSGPYALPSSNNLPYWFYDVSNVAIVNATDITGWFSSYAWDYPYFLTFNVEFWNSTNLLIANDTFNTESQALLLYNGYSATNPDAAGNSVIWGNYFLQAPSTILVPASYGLGLSEQENFDTIYNNYFATATTAVSFPTDLYYGYVGGSYYDAWNITPTAASTVNYDSNWPAFALTGSIIGGTTQGGNYWWDYGLSTSPFAFRNAETSPSANSNPYPVLPYTETGWIDFFGYYGTWGDFAPLLYSALYNVTISIANVPSGSTWSYAIFNTTDPAAVYWSNTTSLSSDSFVLPNGVYGYSVIGPSGYFVANGTFTVSGADTSFTASAFLGGGAVSLLYSVYENRGDLQYAFWNAFEDSSQYTLLVNWAGGVVTGAITDSNSSTLAPYAYYYALMYVYDGRADLQSVFPGAFTDSAQYTLLVNWAGGVVTNSFVDSDQATLTPFGYYYALMVVYDGRADLQAAFPSAFTNATSYQHLLTWAKNVVTPLFPDSAYHTLLPFKASYEALG